MKACDTANTFNEADEESETEKVLKSELTLGDILSRDILSKDIFQMISVTYCPDS